MRKIIESIPFNTLQKFVRDNNISVENATKRTCIVDGLLDSNISVDVILNSLTVDDLRSLCANFNLVKVGTKAILIGRLLQNVLGKDPEKDYLQSNYVSTADQCDISEQMVPNIDFRHVMRELSINRDDPCEIIRELISNAYDAQATCIEYYPIASRMGFVFFDNGEGLSMKVVPGKPFPGKEISPYRAFFSIGCSTKSRGRDVGYKCQGSKLLFASKRLLIISKSIGDDAWRYKIIENPSEVIENTFDITPSKTLKPWEVLSTFVPNPDADFISICERLGEDFFSNLTRGTMIVLSGLPVEEFTKFNTVDDKGKPEGSYLYNYLKFNTKHGDIRFITSEQGFPERSLSSLNEYAKQRTALKIWIGDRMHDIPYGYSYLAKAENITEIKSPANVSSLNDGRFFARAARRILHNNNVYCLVMAVDGNRRALEGYPYLLRRGGGKKEGLQFSSQRGCFIAAQGVKVCSYQQIFNLSALEGYECLGNIPTAKTHFVFLIDGPFDLVTDRNGISDTSKKIIQSAGFVEKIKEFLDEFQKESSVFKELLTRLRGEESNKTLDKELEYQRITMNYLSKKDYFRIEGIEQLKDRVFLVPDEEYMVGSLYYLLSHFVTPNKSYYRYWYRPLTFSSRGIDSICQNPGVNDLASDFTALEYKYKFSRESFNHPLSCVGVVLVWSLDEEKQGGKVSDDFGHVGVIRHIDYTDPMLAFSIAEIEREGVRYNDVTVISLRELIKRTWKTWRL